jgi:hypothetical protein
VLHMAFCSIERLTNLVAIESVKNTLVPD